MSESYKIQEFVAHSTRVNCLSIGPKSKQVLATGGEDSKVNVWRIGDVSNIWTLGYNKSPIESLCFDSEELNVVSGAMNGSLKVFDLNEGRLARSLSGHQVNISSLQYHPYGEFIVSGSVDCTMKVWDVRNKACIQTYTGHSKEVNCVRFSPDGKWVASSSKDGQMLLWDLVAGKLVTSIKLAPTYVTSFEFNPTEFSLAAICSNRTVRVWDLDTMEVVCSTPPESSAVKAITFSNLGTSFCSTAKDTLKVWSMEPSLHLKGTIEMGWDKIVDMAVSNNSHLIAGSHMSNFVSLWAVDIEDYLTNQNDEEEEPVIVSSNNSNKVKNNVASVDEGRGVRPPSENDTAEAASTPTHVTKNRLRQNHQVQQDQLSRVQNQLSQLKSDLGLSDEAQEKANDDFRANRARQANGVPPRKDFISHEEDTKGLPNGGESPYLEVAAAEPRVDPSVEWDPDSSPKELATSMGESFWRRFKEKQLVDEEEIRRRLGNRDSTDGDSKGIALNDVDSINSKLPSSNYGNGPVEQSPRSGKSGGNVQPSEPVTNKRDRSSYRGVPIGNVVTPTNMKEGGGLEVVGQRHSQRTEVPVEIYPDNRSRPVSQPRTSAESHMVNSRSDREKCEDQLERVMAGGQRQSAILAQRLTSFKILRQLWNKGQVMDALDHLRTLCDSMHYNPQNLVVLADFIDAIDFRGNGLSLDSCLKMLQILDEMMGMSEAWTSMHVIDVAYRSFTTLAEAFGELIRQTRSIIVAGGVDLSRESRLDKCNACNEIFLKAKSRVDELKHRFRKSPKIIDVLETYQRIASQYFN